MIYSEFLVFAQSILFPIIGQIRLHSRIIRHKAIKLKQLYNACLPMTSNKLKNNLEQLRKRIARKPTEHTGESATNLVESFTKYTRTRTINLILSLSELFQSHDWVLPIYLSRADPKDVLEYLDKLPTEQIKAYDIEGFNKFVDSTMINLFVTFKKEVFRSWKGNKLFQGKEEIISQLEVCYDYELWISCISTGFPLLDHLIRIFFKTRNFEKDISYILTMFNNAGISSSDLKPGYIAQNRAKELGNPNYVDAIQNDLRLIGIALGSFLDNADIFYKYYRKDKVDLSDYDHLNRHALIHGAPENYNSKLHATKLLIFIDLTLELEPVFQILLKED